MKIVLSMLFTTYQTLKNKISKNIIRKCIFNKKKKKKKKIKKKKKKKKFKKKKKKKKKTVNKIK